MIDVLTATVNVGLIIQDLIIVISSDIYDEARV